MEGQTICPHCERQGRPVGSRCESQGCAEKGYNFIPLKWYESALAYARKKGRPLDPLIGLYVDKYLVCSILGQGGMGAVYLALQMPLKREVALKLMANLQMGQTALARFEREAASISRLDHPNIVKLYDFGFARGAVSAPFMALEYVRHGRTLGEALLEVRREHNGEIPASVIMAVFRQVLFALAAAHKMRIVHRDLKPENIMITKVEGNPYHVKILDFGLAKAIEDVSSVESGPTRPGDILGTPYYMAPEQAPLKGRPRADERSDLYAVAVMLFEIVTGREAFTGESHLEILMKKSDPKWLPTELPEAKALDPKMRAFLEKGLAINPEERFQSADEMLLALEEVLAEAKPVGPGTRPIWERQRSDRPFTPESEPGETLSYEVMEGGSFGGAKDGKGQREPWASEDLPFEREKGRFFLFALPTLAAFLVGAALLLYFTGQKGKLDQGGDKGEAVEALSKVIGRQSQGQYNFLIVTNPPGASVKVDGRVIGLSPALFSFEGEGEEWKGRVISIEAEMKGYSAATKAITLGEAMRLGVVEVTLEREALFKAPTEKAKTQNRPRAYNKPKSLDNILGPDVEGGIGPQKEGPEPQKGDMEPKGKGLSEPPPAPKKETRPSIPML